MSACKTYTHALPYFLVSTHLLQNKTARKEDDENLGDGRSQYERDIDGRRHGNNVFKHQLGLVGLLFFVSTKGIPRIPTYVLAFLDHVIKFPRPSPSIFAYCK